MLFSYAFFVCLFAVKYKIKELLLLTHTKSLQKSGKYYHGINLWKKTFVKEIQQNLLRRNIWLSLTIWLVKGKITSRKKFKKCLNWKCFFSKKEFFISNLVIKETIFIAHWFKCQFLQIWELFPLTFLHKLRGAPSQPVNVDACVVFHISEGSATNPLQNVKKGLENLMKFCKKFNQTGLEEHLERQEQLHENYRKIKVHKTCQR